MKKFVLAGLVSTLLVACGTSVPLNDVPVEDATARTVRAGAGAGAAGSGVQGSGVAPVDLGRAVDQAPAPA
jgi:peptidoglycan-associated lipoprotein